MARQLQIVRRGWSWVTRHHPQELAAAAGLPLVYGPRLLDPLDWGPQHVDLDLQVLLRRCYHRHAARDDTEAVAACTEALSQGADLVFWGHPDLASALSILWAVDWLHRRGADLQHAHLVLDARLPTECPGRSIEELHSLLEARVPVADCLTRLLQIRRHLASDSGPVERDLRGLPEPLRAWAVVTGRLADCLPDARGLDFLDSMILDLLDED